MGTPENRELNSSLLAFNEAMPGDIGLQILEQSESAAKYTFTYPAIDETHTFLMFDINPYCLNDLIGISYIKLSFENSVNLSSVQIEGANADKVSLYYTTINPDLGYDDYTAYSWTRAEGQTPKWLSDRGEQVTSLCIYGDFSGQESQELTITVCGKAEVAA